MQLVPATCTARSSGGISATSRGMAGNRRHCEERGLPWLQGRSCTTFAGGLMSRSGFRIIDNTSSAATGLLNR